MLTIKLNTFTLLAAAISVCISAQSVYAAGSNLAGKLPAVISTSIINQSEREYHRQVADEVKNLIYRELEVKERKELAGTSAIVEIKYTTQGQFDTANVTSSSMNKLANTVHRKMVWKSIPTNGSKYLSQTISKMNIDIDYKGEVKLSLDTI